MDKDLARWLEVDDLVHQLSDAFQHSDKEKLVEARHGVEQRISQLDVYYREHHPDKLSALLEEQRGKLSGALQSFPQGGDAAVLPLSPVVVAEVMELVATGDHEARGAEEGCETPAASVISTTLRSKEAAAVEDEHHVVNEEVAAQTGRRKEKKSRPRVLASIKPLYKWELPPEEREALDATTHIPAIETECRVFRPGDHKGYYHREVGEDDRADYSQSPVRTAAAAGIGSPHASNSILDFQVVLTESEYLALQARRRGSAKYNGSSKLPQALTARDSSATPFIDRWRIEDGVYRSSSKDKGQWLSPRGFSTTC